MTSDYEQALKDIRELILINGSYDEWLATQIMMVIEDAEYELAARWYRFFCNQGFEAEILANRYGVVLRLNGVSFLSKSCHQIRFWFLRR